MNYILLLKIIRSKVSKLILLEHKYFAALFIAAYKNHYLQSSTDESSQEVIQTYCCTDGGNSLLNLATQHGWSIVIIGVLNSKKD